MNVSRGFMTGLVLLLAAGAACAAGDAGAGKTKTLVCQACHGPDGNSPHNPGWSNLTFEDLLRQDPRARGSLVWPKLAGQNPAYLVKQLNNFKSGQRVDPVMSDMVAGLARGKRHSENMEPLATQLSDDEIKALSYYLTALP